MTAPEIILRVERGMTALHKVSRRLSRSPIRAHAVYTPTRRRSRSCCSARYHCVAQVESTDAQIDRLVYELYGLKEEEIMIVEVPPPGLPSRSILKGKCRTPKVPGAGNTEFGGGEGYLDG